MRAEVTAPRVSTLAGPSIPIVGLPQTGLVCRWVCIPQGAACAGRWQRGAGIHHTTGQPGETPDGHPTNDSHDLIKTCSSLGLQAFHTCGNVVPDHNSIASHERTHTACRTHNQMLDTRGGHTQMLKCRAIENAVMLIIYLTSQGLKVGWRAALAGAGLPWLALPSARLHPQRMRPKPKTG